MTPPGLAFVAANDQGARRRTRRPACARSIGTGRSARAKFTTRSTAARRRSTCCSASARRSTCCWRKGWTMAFRRHALLAEATRAAVDQVGRRAGAGLQHHQSGRAGQLDHLHPRCRAAIRSRCSTIAATNAESSSASAWASWGVRPSASPTWATATPHGAGHAGRRRDGPQGAGHPARGRRHAGGGGIPGARSAGLRRWPSSPSTPATGPARRRHLGRRLTDNRHWPISPGG